MTESLAAPGARLIDASTGLALEGAVLAERIDGVATELEPLPTGAVFALTESSVDAALRCLGAWTAHRPVLPVDPSSTDAALEDLLTRFSPAVLTGLGEDHLARLGPAAGYRTTVLPALGPSLVREVDSPVPPHPDLAVLLSTSGSTGRPKLVRLSRSGIVANANAIAGALDIGPDSVAATTLPLFYSYGLSVLTSHLRAGATVVFTDGDVTGPALWAAVGTHGVTTLPLVPSQFEMLRRMRWRPDGQTRIRSMTAAGGRLRDETALHFHAGLSAHGGRLSVMYGQTEAGPRISILPPDQLERKIGSVGPAIPGVRLSIRLTDGTETVDPGLSGEVICHGPGVMMGYADEALDLAEPDSLGSTLRTGDLGRLDEDGYLWLSGRTNRIGKIFGIRVDLDAVERTLTAEGPVAAVAAGDAIRIWVEGPERRGAELARDLADHLRVPRSGVDVRFLDLLPTLPNGKTDYRALETL